jgi:hypothetical protein
MVVPTRGSFGWVSLREWDWVGVPGLGQPVGMPGGPADEDVSATFWLYSATTMVSDLRAQ